MENNINTKIEFMEKIFEERKMFRKKTPEERLNMIREHVMKYPNITELEIILLAEKLYKAEKRK